MNATRLFAFVILPVMVVVLGYVVVLVTERWQSRDD
jgi:hypothetical protein